MSRRNVARAGGDKPALVPLPVDPVRLAHAAISGQHKPPTRALTAGVTATRARILAILATQDLSLGEAARELDCELHQAQHVLRSLKRDGLIVHHGNDNKSRWRLADQQGVA